MAKPLGAKSLLIRQAITAHPDKGNTEIAGLLMDADERMDDKIKVTAQDVATQRQAMKKSGSAPAAKPAAAKPGRKPGRHPASRETVTAPAPPAPAPASTADVFAHIEAIREAVRKLGADQVRRIVGLFE